MPYTPPASLPRLAVVDLGSNSVRLVVFEGYSRNPVAIFNEKAVLRLGRGMQASGLLNAEAVGQALTVMNRYGAIARAMGAARAEVLATAAVRDAANGADFVAELTTRLPDMPIRILSGDEEAQLAADGLLCGIPDADGMLADLGGGSLEVVELTRGGKGRSASTRLGAIRLAERADGDPVRARAIAEADLADISWLSDGAGRDLYAVGGAWRALARIHIAQTGYPLNMVHHYTISRDEARDLTGVIASANRRTLERLPGAPRRRLDDLPFAAIALRRMLRATGARRVVFSANGLREGWYMRQIPDAERHRDAMLAAGQDYAQRLGRDPTLPPALVTWTNPLFPTETTAQHRLRTTACWLSDIGSHDHPEYRAEQSFLRILRHPGIGLDHHARAFLALTLALRYEAEPASLFLAPAQALLGPDDISRANTLGIALRLAYTLSAGTTDLLAGTRLQNGHTLTLELAENSGVFAGESVTRRLDRLATAMGLDATTRLAAA